MHVLSLFRAGGDIRSTLRALLLPLLVLLMPTTAWAAGGGDPSQLVGVLVLVLVVGAAYLLTHSLVELLQKTLFISTSVEYLVLGALIGIALFPSTSALDIYAVTQGWIGQWSPSSLGLGDLTSLAPLIALSAGWIGLLYGTKVDFSQLVQRRDGAIRLAIVEGVFMALPIAITAYFVMMLVLDRPHRLNDPAVLCAGVIGLTAWAGSTSAIEFVSLRDFRSQRSPHVLQTLVRSAQYSDILSILVFGALFATFHDISLTSASPSVTVSDFQHAITWLAITLAIGAILGLLLSFFLDDDDSDTGTLLALAGIIAFASGAAYFLDLSEITVSLVLGITIGLTRFGTRIRASVEGTKRPMSLLLLLMAGTLWTAPTSWREVWLTAALFAAVVGMRWLGKVISSRVASAATSLQPEFWRGLLGQGDVAIAMAVTFKIIYDVRLIEAERFQDLHDMVDATYTVILLSVMLHEILAPRLLRNLLVDLGVIRNQPQQQDA